MSDAPFDGALTCRDCGANRLGTKHVVLWRPGPYGKQIREDEWFERACRQCSATWTETIHEAGARARGEVETPQDFDALRFARENGILFPAEPARAAS